MLTIQKLLVLCSLPLTATFLAGCFGAVEPAPEESDVLMDSADEGEPVGEVESALGEAGCTTVAADEGVGIWPACGWYVVTSADASYDHGASCPNQFVGEFSFVGDSASAVSKVVWSDVPAANSTECGNMHMEKAVYRYVNGAWSPTVHIMKFHGEWIGGACTFKSDAGYSEIVHQPASTYRVVGSAYSVACSPSGCLVTKKKVSVGMHKWPC